jgi:hypothetical protein
MEPLDPDQDLDLPPSRRPSTRAIVAIAVVVVLLVIVIALHLAGATPSHGG